MTFKLPDFLGSHHLNALRREMGAPLSNSFMTAQRYVPIDLPIPERLKKGGIDVTFDEIEILDDGTLSYKGYRVLLYIRDIANYGDRHKLPRYHVAYCHTLQRMKQDKRFDRYVVAHNDDGQFHVNVMGDTTVARIVTLNVCQFCLGDIRWKGFDHTMSRDQRLQAVSTFSLKEFFVAYPRDLISDKPKHTSSTAPVNEYTSDWRDIADDAKHQARYRCQSCNVELRFHLSRFLHVHHTNGLKHDNRSHNLEVLCIRCHANQPQHGHMLALPDYAEFMSLNL
jgi:hypothetical protein